MCRDHPEGSWGSIGWGHLSWRAPWVEVGKGTSPWWAGAPPLGPPPAPRVGTLGVGAPHLAWGASHPLGRRPPLEIPSPRAGAPRGPIYSGGREGCAPLLLAPPCPSVTPLPLAELGEALPRSPLLPPPRRCAAGSPSTSPSSLLDQEGGDVFPTARVLNAEVPSIRR